MTGMPQIQSIRRMRRNGESIAAIARRQHVSEPTVRKYLRMDDLSEKPPVRRTRGSVIDPYLPLIGQWLAEDRASWRKQRHTATRIWERLRDEHGAEVSLSTVTRAVARLRRESAVEPGGAFMDLVWHPGEAQADFGEVDVLYRGAVQRMRHFVLDFPYSNIGLAQLMPGENAECACQALQDLFEWLGGVPERGRGDARDARIDRQGRRGRRHAPRGQARRGRGTHRIRGRPSRPERIRHRVHRHGRGRGRRGMMAARNDEGLYAKARSLFISRATMDDFAGWATPRQTEAVSRLFDTELANRERSKRECLLRRARFPVVKGPDGYDFSNVRLPDGYALDGLLDLDFVPRAQDLVFYGKTGRGKTHLAIGLGMRAVERGLSVRFHQTAELVLQLGKAKRDGNLDAMLRDFGRADLIILDEFGYVPFDIDGARLLYQIIAGSYERRSIVSATNIESGKWGTIFADDKLAAAIIDRIVHHGRLLEFTGQSHRVSEALMFGRTPAGTTSGSKEKTKEQAGTLLD